MYACKHAAHCTQTPHALLAQPVHPSIQAFLTHDLLRLPWVLIPHCCTEVRVLKVIPPNKPGRSALLVDQIPCRLTSRHMCFVHRAKATTLRPHSPAYSPPSLTPHELQLQGQSYSTYAIITLILNTIIDNESALIAGPKLQHIRHHHPHSNHHRRHHLIRPGLPSGSLPRDCYSGSRLLHRSHQLAKLQFGPRAHLGDELCHICAVCADVAGQHLHCQRYVPLCYHDRRGHGGWHSGKRSSY